MPGEEEEEEEEERKKEEGKTQKGEKRRRSACWERWAVMESERERIQYNYVQ